MEERFNWGDGNPRHKLVLDHGSRPHCRDGGKYVSLMRWRLVFLRRGYLETKRRKTKPNICCISQGTPIGSVNCWSRNPSAGPVNGSLEIPFRSRSRHFASEATHQCGHSRVEGTVLYIHTNGAAERPTRNARVSRRKVRRNLRGPGVGRYKRHWHENYLFVLHSLPVPLNPDPKSTIPSVPPLLNPPPSPLFSEIHPLDNPASLLPPLPCCCCKRKERREKRQ